MKVAVIMGSWGVNTTPFFGRQLGEGEDGGECGEMAVA